MGGHLFVALECRIRCVTGITGTGILIEQDSLFDAVIGASTVTGKSKPPWFPGKAACREGRREKGESFWGYVGLIGAVGWGIVLPMIIGVGVGLWLDRRFGSGSRLTLLLLLLGLSVGCVNAWRTITREH